MKQSSPTLDLHKLKKGLPGISRACGNYLIEAGKVCFDNQGFESGVVIKLEGTECSGCVVVWKGRVTDQLKRTWSDMQVAVEHGACSIAILLAITLTDYTVVERAVKGTGIDYWLGKKEEGLPFQHSARLEVSGILKGAGKPFRARLKQKLLQTSVTDDDKLPAYVVVVEFSTPKAGVQVK